MYGLYMGAVLAGGVKKLMSLHRSQGAAYSRREKFRGYLEEMGFADMENSIPLYTVEEVEVDLHEDDE